MKVKYIGESFYGIGLTDGQVYECLGVEDSWLRIIDDEGYEEYESSDGETLAGYLYDIVNPGPLDLDEGKGGRWEIIEDDDKGTLAKAFAEKQIIR